MKKRFLSMLTVISMLAAFVVIPAASADTGIKLGDYVQMGTYYGEPILWRCVSFEKISGYDDNGNPIIDSTDTVTEYQDGYLPLMLSDKILCLKAFDAAGENTNSSHGRDIGRTNRGSNYWADSNMRSWLNSNEGAGNVTWICGNPPIESKIENGYNEYENEAGFLTNFTQIELETIKTVTQKSMVASPEYENGMYTYGTSGHEWDISIANGVTNYSDTYSEQVTDNIFLPDVKQANTVYINGDVLGNRYYIGNPTEQCVENSEYKDSSLAYNKTWYYWLRTPDGTCDGDEHDSYWVRCIQSNGAMEGFARNLNNDGAYSSYVGVRPAFFLSDTVAFTSGSGTESEPYTVVGKNTTTVPTATPTPTETPTSSVHFGEAPEGEISIFINYMEIYFDQMPVIIDDRTMVPLRAIFQALGADVAWDEATRTVTSTSGSTTVTLTIGSNVLNKNGVEVFLDVPAQIYNDYTYVPVRAVAEAFGATVEWRETSRAVYIFNTPKINALLINADNDLTGYDTGLFREILLSNILAEVDDQNIKSYTEPTKDQFEQLINELILQAGEDDITYFLYSGHGGFIGMDRKVYSPEEDTFIQPYYSHTSGHVGNDENLYIITMKRLADEYLSRIPGTIVVILNNCYSGGMTESGFIDNNKFKVLTAAGSLEEADTDNIGLFTKGQFRTSNFMDALFKGLGGLESDNIIERYIFKYDGQIKADYNDDGNVTLSELYKYIDENMEKEFKDEDGNKCQQNPTVSDANDDTVIFSYINN